MVKIILNVLALLTVITAIAISQTAFALSSVTASIDANPVMKNDSIILTVIADDNVERDALDTSMLLKDFVVARTEVSSQTSMINFETSRTTRWKIILIPKTIGSLTIPPLTIDGHSSQPINVQVVEQSNATSTQQKDVFISTELSSKDIYVQQLLTLTVKLHVGVQLQRGSLTEPSLQGATIEQVGKDQESDNIVNGKRYRIIERTYAITPEQSGNLILETPMFSGDIMVQSQRRSGFLSFGDTKPINIIGEKIALNVRPIPDSFSLDKNTSWLPSELLTLHQEWQPEPQEFKVGEPITRTITLTAAGLAKAQLPQIMMEAPSGLKIYPDQPELHSNLTKERLISQKRQNFALVASQPGDYTLPKITIAWWNTITNKYQEAILPEQTISIKPNPDAPTSVTSNMVNTPIVSQGQTAVSPVPLSPPNIVEKTSSLQWLFLGLWILTTFAWACHVWYLKRTTTKQVEPNKIKAVNNHYLALMAACKKNDAEQTLNLVLPWLNTLPLNQGGSAISTLSEALIKIDNEEFTSAIDEIQLYLYGKDVTEQTWVGDKLLKAIQQINASGNKNKQQPKFTLNPS
ncbi:BatD family protein [Colwellia sp. 1_MG-2023]|uniref:BatD family protein n=1 Tax=unclassified Colwellia TaxID=196834 RepID=UPI0026E182F3|nr:MULTISPECIES: BatD family protein [unclassified Colwellia]MDO6651005.1 BatD family protein [Colwellia sp. 3_MG-2023]MDO6664040.1 BatD family protein [Colwellia sp. 2_MG-2023]MDO6688391.1 BatD family protein [Colwellia sp. 1_MG-2023]